MKIRGSFSQKQTGSMKMNDHDGRTSWSTVKGGENIVRPHHHHGKGKMLKLTELQLQ